MQSSVLSKTTQSVSLLLQSRRRSELFMFLALFVTMLCLTPVVVFAGTAVNFTYILGALVALLLTTLIFFKPVVGFYCVAICAILIEQGPMSISGMAFNVYVFYWPNGFTGLPERPIGFIILFIFLIVVCKNFAKRRKILAGGDLLVPLLLFLACIVMGVAHGLSSGGDFKIIVLEIRPFWYLFLSYLLAYNLISHWHHIRLLFWFVILGAGLKGLQGTYIYLITLHGHLAGHHEIMAHEESFFFAALLLLIILFSFHHNYRPQLIAALVVLPFVFIAFIANQRRTDYIAFLVGMIVALILIFQIKPKVRGKILAFLVIAAALLGGYVALFANAEGAFAEPAHGIISVFSPQADSNDYYSNLYRTYEDSDLKATVQQSPLIGYGFGKQFLQPYPLPNLAGDNTNVDFNGNPYLYIPHNTIYWVWMRLGALGYFTFWLLIGLIIVRGCILARKLQNRYLQLVAIYVVAVTFMEISVAFADYQLYFYRNIIFFGLLAGILMKLPALDTPEEAVEA